MNRRTLAQLRRSRTKVTSATGVPTLPDNVAGVPIVITDSLGNDETGHSFLLKLDLFFHESFLRRG